MAVIAAFALASALGQFRLAPGDHEIGLPHGGRDRAYLVHVPPAVTSGSPLPVVLDFHGGGGDARGQRDWTGIDRLADREGFVSVHPEGTGRFSGRLHTWNAGWCCGYAQSHDVDDVRFVLALLDDLARRVPVDRTRVYATGLSNGAMMSYRLAVEAADRIAAIAPVAGAMVVERFAPSRPVPVLHVHSRDDPRAPFAGGLGPRLPFLIRVAHPPVEETIARWVEHDGCATAPVTDSPRRDADGHTATRRTHAPCRDGSEVVLWTLTGAGHTWPGAPSRHPEWLLGAPTSVLDANQEIWRFFRRFTRPDAPTP